jgi:hypothetical protein
MAVQSPHILPSLVVSIRERQVRASTYLPMHIGKAFFITKCKVFSKGIEFGQVLTSQ